MDDFVIGGTTTLGDDASNNDRFKVWRNHEDENGNSVPMIGYVHLAFRLVIDAMYDFVCGDALEIEEASIFFYGNHTVYAWCTEMLGVPRNWVPILVERVHGGKSITPTMRAELENWYVQLEDMSSRDMVSMAEAIRTDYVTKTTKHL